MDSPLQTIFGQHVSTFDWFDVTGLNSVFYLTGLTNEFDWFDVTDRNSTYLEVLTELRWPFSRLLLHLEGRSVGIPHRSEQTTQTLARVEVHSLGAACARVYRGGEHRPGSSRGLGAAR